MMLSRRSRLSRVTVLFLVGLFSACASAQQPAQPTEKITPVIVAHVDGQPIYFGDVERMVAAVVRGQTIDPNSMAAVQAGVLNQAIDQKILQRYLEAEKLAATPGEVDEMLAKIKTQLKQQNVSYDEFLVKSKQTETTIRDQLMWELTWNKHVQRSSSEAALNEFFNAHRDQFDGTERRVSHILLRPEGKTDETAVRALIARAAELREQINAGQLTFADAAAKYSAGPSRAKSGDLGFIGRQGPMVAAFSQAAFALQPGTLSQPVVTPFGVHLIQVTDIKPGKKTVSDVRPQLAGPFSQWLLQKTVAGRRAETKIEFAGNYPYFKPGTRELVLPGK